MDEWTNINEGLPKPDQVVEVYSRHPQIRWQTAQFRSLPNNQGFIWVATLNMDFPLPLANTLDKTEGGEYILPMIYDWKQKDEPPAYPTNVIRDDSITGTSARKAG